jgi:16S rRNA (cytosine967-C5)-methyltransferase
VRKSILQNLSNRFLRAGIKDYRSFIADSATTNTHVRVPYDLIICDAPCSGSGTWSRSPEQLYFFTKDKIDYYSNLQKRIVKNVSRFLAANGHLLYITCSVFEKENEDVVAWVQQHTNLKARSTTYYKGYNIKGDTLFVALFSA